MGLCGLFSCCGDLCGYDNQTSDELHLLTNTTPLQDAPL